MTWFAASVPSPATPLPPALKQRLRLALCRRISSIERPPLRASLMTLKQNFATNLRLLCGRHRSVSELCRRLAINRQQFNKYLAGTSLPSPATLGRICAFFAIDQGDILLAPAAFAASADARPKEQGPLPPPLFAPT